MPEANLITGAGYVFSLFYGTAAVYLVFETQNECPFRWPLFFGLIGSLSHFALHQLPTWWPPSITRDMVGAAFLIALTLLGAELLRRLIIQYQLRPPVSPPLDGVDDGGVDDSRKR